MNNADFLELIMKKRKSIRKYIPDTSVSNEDIEKILQAGLLAPSSRNFRSCELIYIPYKNIVSQLAECKSAGSIMLKEASQAIIVIGDKNKSDVWIEDCSIAMTHMYLMATALNIGNCWVQCRLRDNKGISAEDYIKELLHIPKHYGVLAILSLGVCDKDEWNRNNIIDDKRMHSVDRKGSIIW